MIRTPSVAGTFYPIDSDELKESVTGFLKETPRETALAVITPHAGYIYSGSVAGSVFSSVKIPDTVILIGPNHTGIGEEVSLMAEGSWETPLGTVEVDSELASQILDSNPFFMEDRLAHLKEHSLEVQLPFIQSENPAAKIVPITVMHAGLERSQSLGLALADVIRSSKKDILIIVSSDMNHYEDDDTTRKKDHAAIDKVVALDPEGLVNVAKEDNITMCGLLPATIALFACLELGASEARLVDYNTSGKISGDYRHVVGYAGFLIK